MAARLGSVPPSSNSAVSHAPYKPALEPLKLRNSCQSCAASKLKCPQEKPRCSRCARRGVTCKYLAAKPGGRKPSRRQAANNDQTTEAITAATTATDPSVNYMPSSSQHCCFMPLPSSAPDDGSGLMDVGCLHVSCASVTSNDPTQHLFMPLEQGSPSSFDYSNAAQNLFSTLDQFPLSASTTASQIDFGDCLSFEDGLADMDVLETHDAIFPTVLGETSRNGGSIDRLVRPLGTFSPLGDTISELFTVPTSAAELEATVSPAGYAIMQTTRDTTASREAPPRHSCLIQALRSMEKVSSPQTASEALAIPAIRAIVAQNRDVVEAVAAMANCACLHDSYLLVVVSLVVFKVLNRYNIAARQGASDLYAEAPTDSRDGAGDPSAPRWRTSGKGRSLTDPTTPDHHEGSLEYCLEGENSGRMVAQLVLSELHLVRRVVEQLSSKLKSQAASGGTESLEDVGGDLLMALPLSSTCYGNIAISLTQRLRALASDVIGQLKTL